MQNLYPRLLRDAWAELHDSVRGAHLEQTGGVLHGHGVFQVRRGRNWLARAALRCLQLPQEAEAVPLLVTVSSRSQGEIWRREFGECTVTSLQEERPGHQLGEQFGLVELRFRLAAENGALVYHQVRAVLRLGRLSLPLPRRFSPQTAAREEPGGAPHRTRVTVEISHPLLGFLIRYGGEVEWRQVE